MKIDWLRIINSFYQARLVVGEMFADFFSSLATKLYLLATFIVNIILWVSAFFIYNLADHGLVILHYNIDFGIDLIGQPREFFILPIFGLMVIIINSWIAMFIGRKGRFSAHLLLGSALLVNCLLGFILFLLFNINFR